MALKVKSVLNFLPWLLAEFRMPKKQEPSVHFSLVVFYFVAPVCNLLRQHKQEILLEWHQALVALYNH
jgi:hypothetical protein